MLVVQTYTTESRVCSTRFITALITPQKKLPFSKKIDCCTNHKRNFLFLRCYINHKRNFLFLTKTACYINHKRNFLFSYTVNLKGFFRQLKLHSASLSLWILCLMSRQTKTRELPVIVGIRCVPLGSCNSGHTVCTSGLL